MKKVGPNLLTLFLGRQAIPNFVEVDANFVVVEMASATSLFVLATPVSHSQKQVNEKSGLILANLHLPEKLLVFNLCSGAVFPWYNPPVGYDD